MNNAQIKQSKIKVDYCTVKSPLSLPGGVNSTVGYSSKAIFVYYNYRT